MKKKVLDYLKRLTYNVLELLSALVNTLGAMFGLELALCWGVSFLVILEAPRVMEEIGNREKRREELKKEADNKFTLAKEEIDDGKEL